MVSLLDILKEQITSIPTYNISKSANKVYQIFKKLYPEVPEYIIKDYLNNKDFSSFTKSEIMQGIKQLPNFLKLKYELKILNVNPADFTNSTIDWFIERDFGDIVEPTIPDDEERTARQREIARGDGKNEPIVVIQTFDGKYDLVEGWHRTMANLKLGDNGKNIKDWDKVKIKAFVSKE